MLRIPVRPQDGRGMREDQIFFRKIIMMYRLAFVLRLFVLAKGTLKCRIVILFVDCYLFRIVKRCF